MTEPAASLEESRAPTLTDPLSSAPVDLPPLELDQDIIDHLLKWYSQSELDAIRRRLPVPPSQTTLRVHTNFITPPELCSRLNTLLINDQEWKGGMFRVHDIIPDLLVLDAASQAALDPHRPLVVVSRECGPPFALTSQLNLAQDI